MCGISGIVADEPRRLSAEIRRMTEALRHRGPDGTGFVALDPAGPHNEPASIEPPNRVARVWLGHRRLSIIDPAGTAQPLRNEDGTVWVTFNGEIYNHTELRETLAAAGHDLREAGDTEVLVHLWEQHGAAMTEQLVGMFSFAIYDTRQATLFIARDRFGQKPLYIWHTAGRLAFASELQALWTLDDFDTRDIDPLSAAQYFRYGYVPSPRTIYRGVQSLPPGHHAMLRDGQLTVTEYWRPRVAGRPGAVDTERLEAALDDAVRLRLRSDVPLGAFLSGGIDSALVVASMARSMDRPVDTLTISTGGGWLDESDDARRTATHLSTAHREVAVEPDLVAVAEQLATHYGQPFADYSLVPTYYVSREARRHVTVALTGDGGDELFGGYRRYANQRWAGLAGHVPLLLRRVAAGLTRLIPAGRNSFPGRLADFLVTAGPVAHKGENLTHMFHEMWRRELFTPELSGLLDEAGRDGVARFRSLAAEAESGDPVERWMEVDQRLYLADDLLVKVDIASMAVSLECRAPMLDHRFAELANALARSEKLGGGETKLALRRLAARRLPPEVAGLPKRGFTLPLADWLRGDLAEYARTTIFDGRGAWEGYLREPALRRLWSEHESGRYNHAGRLWLVLAWCHWYRACEGAQ